MEISHKRNIPQYLYNIIKLLKYSKNPILLLGTAGLESQKYYSDFDFFTKIEQKQTAKQIYDNIYKIVEDSERFNDLYFIEFKVQTKDNKKLKYNTLEEFNFNEFSKYYKELDFIKLDFVARIQNKFIELSIIYSFGGEKLEDDKFIKNIVEDIKELRKEGNYYKALKRVFSIYNLKYTKDELKNTKNYIFLSKFFNSEWGQLYSETANLKAIKLLLEHYDDEETIKRALLNLKELGIEPNLDIIDNLIKKNENEYNKKAEGIFPKLKKI